VKPIQWRRSWAGKYLRRLPRLKQLRGTFLHRLMGERLFEPRLWHWDRRGMALGFAIGAFFSALPIPLQSAPAAILAVLLRANVPAALVGCWVSNPVTMPLFIYLQLRAGSWLLGRPSLLAQWQEQSLVQLFKAAPGVLFVGGAVLGAALAVVCYFLALLGYDLVIRTLRHSSKKPRTS
jgi:uncharacterized protein (DUF2062 family)